MMKLSKLVALAVACTVAISGASAYGDLISHWKLDDASGAAVDSAGSNDGTVGTGITQGASGQIGTAYTFTGVDGVDVANDASLNPTSLTVSAWVNMTTDAKHQGVVDKFTSGEGGYALYVYEGQARFNIGTSGNLFITSGTTTVNNGAWHMLTATFDGTDNSMELFVDGTSLSTGSYPLAHSDDALDIGGDGASSYFFNGSIDDIGLWNEVLSDGRISEIYNFGKDGKDLTTVPEPGTLSLILVGLCMLLVRRRIVRR